MTKRKNFFSKHKQITIFGLTDRDFWHHVVLLGILLLGVLLFFAASPHRLLQFAVGIFLAVSYVVWGIVHHKLDGDYHFKSVVEYVLVAVLAVMILGGILL